MGQSFAPKKRLVYYENLLDSEARIHGSIIIKRKSVFFLETIRDLLHLRTDLISVSGAAILEQTDVLYKSFQEKILIDCWAKREHVAIL